MGFPLDEKFIVECEQELGATLPSSYRTALLANNGGQIETVEDDWDLHPIFDKSDRKRIGRTCNHILAETASCKDWSGFPENALAIASNGMGDQMVFLRSNKAYQETVYFWSHETGALSILANDFSELNRL